MNQSLWNRSLLLVATIVTGASAVSVWLAIQTAPDLLHRVSLVALLPILVAACVSFSLRIFRLYFFLSTSGVSISLHNTVIVQLVGFALSITPAHLGEVFKLQLIRERAGSPLLRTAPLVLLERLTEGGGFLILAIVSAIGIPGLRSQITTPWLIALGLAATIAFAVARVALRPRVNLPTSALPASRWQRILPHLQNLWHGVESTFTLRQISGGLAFSTVARFADGIVLLFAARVLGFNLSPLTAVFVLAVSGLAGGISFLPGGTGAVESTMVGLLALLGATLPNALAITLLARLSSLWLWVALGLLLAFAMRLLPKSPDAKTPSAERGSRRIALASIHPRPLSGQIEGLVGLAQSLENQGYSVTVVSAFPSEKLLGPNRLELTSKHRWLLVDEPFRMLGILVRLVRLAPQVDLIQLNLPTPSFSIVADIVQLLVRVPVVVSYEAHLVQGSDLLRLDRLRAAPAFYVPRLLINNRWVARLTAHAAARYLVTSRYQKAELISVGVPSSRIRRVDNLVPYDKIPRAPRETMRAQLDLPPGRIITYVGHYNHVKGVDILVRAFQQLAARYDDLYLVLAWSGQGASRDWLPLLDQPPLRGRAIQMGRVRVPDLMAASDVVVLPYRLTIGQAVYPAALLEAVAANVPVVTTDLPLLREFAERGQTVLLSPPENPNALAATITRALNDPALARQLTTAQQRWLNQMHPQQVVKEYERVYDQILAEKAPVLRPAPSRQRV